MMHMVLYYIFSGYLTVWFDRAFVLYQASCSTKISKNELLHLLLLRYSSIYLAFSYL